ncbi:amino acid permease-associated region [Natranaerobius thermophilus JW/NM-WN-LF]|uniref:Amino acid permease-associated region n=2 Tax=Natranaerobius TaxID=375928 RepID=B2A565_NATTJ|nr:amino acid permease-associated region [Natranaerobius thermophilus JW/NM-WN-LF]
MIVGTVVGAGIYIIIGPLAVSVGPGLMISYLIALLIAAASSFCYAQVAAIYPTTAATYRYARMFYPETIGFLMGWLRFMTSFYGLALMASGFTEYFDSPWGIDNRIIAAVILTIFYVVNAFGIKTTQLVQSVLVTIVVAGLIVFSGGGLAEINLDNLTPMTEAGMGTIFGGALTAFFAYTGMYFVAEIGDEIEESDKNIPRAIIIASIIIGLLYLSTTLVFSGALGWDTIKAAEPNLAEAAQIIFPGWTFYFIQLSGVVAVIMPINSIYAASCRLLASLSEDGYMPVILAKKNRFNVPGIALTVIYILGILIVSLDLSILYLGAISSLVTLIGMALVAGAGLKILAQEPDKLKEAPFTLSPRVMIGLGIFTIIAVICLAVFSFMEDPLILYSLFIWIGLGLIYFKIRQYYAKTKGYQNFYG